MERIKSVILLTILLVIVSACSKSDYDFSSVENLGISVATQAKKEGISEEEAEQLLDKLTMECGVDNLDKLMENSMKGGSIPSEKDIEKEMLKSLKKRMSGKTLSELLKSEN